MREMWELEVEVVGLPPSWMDQFAARFGIEPPTEIVPLVLHNPYGLVRLVPAGTVSARVVHRCAECGAEVKTTNEGREDDRK